MPEPGIYHTGPFADSKNGVLHVRIGATEPGPLTTRTFMQHRPQPNSPVMMTHKEASDLLSFRYPDQ